MIVGASPQVPGSSDARGLASNEGLADRCRGIHETPTDDVQLPGSRASKVSKSANACGEGQPIVPPPNERGRRSHHILNCNRADECEVDLVE